MKKISPLICCRSKSRFSSVSGFTLIEVIAALAIFALIMVGLSSLLSQTTRLAGRVKERQSTVLSAQIIFDRFQRELTMAYFQPGLKSRTEFVLATESQGPEIQFTFVDSPVRTLFSRRAGGLKLVRYFLNKDEKSGTANLMRAEKNPTSPDDIKELEAQLVVTGIVEWKVEAYDDRSDQWTEAWDNKGIYTTNRIPPAIRMTLQVVDPNQPKAEQKDRMLTYSTIFPILNEVKTK